MAIASTAFNTAMTAVNTISQVGRMGGGALNMLGGGGGIPQAVSQVEVGMSNISAST